MNKKRTQTTVRRAGRNLSLAASNTRDAARLAVTSAEVIARRMSQDATPQECTRMVFEKVAAAQSAWFGAGAAMMSASPGLARIGASGTGFFSMWEAAIAMSVQATSAMLEMQRAIMMPMWATVSANSKRLATATR